MRERGFCVSERKRGGWGIIRVLARNGALCLRRVGIYEREEQDCLSFLI